MSLFFSVNINACLQFPKQTLSLVYYTYLISSITDFPGVPSKEIFDAGSYIQSQARFHRIGQESDKCLVIHLIASNTIDEFIKKTIIDKIQTAAQILDNTAQDDLEKLKGEVVQLRKEHLISILR